MKDYADAIITMFIGVFSAVLILGVGVGFVYVMNLI